MGCNCGGSKQEAREKLQARREAASSARRTEKDPDTYWTGPRKTSDPKPDAK